MFKKNNAVCNRVKVKTPFEIVDYKSYLGFLGDVDLDRDGIQRDSGSVCDGESILLWKYLLLL